MERGIQGGDFVRYHHETKGSIVTVKSGTQLLGPFQTHQAKEVLYQWVHLPGS